MKSNLKLLRISSKESLSKSRKSTMISKSMSLMLLILTQTLKLMLTWRYCSLISKIVFFMKLPNWPTNWSNSKTKPSKWTRLINQLKKRGKWKNNMTFIQSRSNKTSHSGFTLKNYRISMRRSKSKNSKNKNCWQI